MSKISIIGAGNIGGTIAYLAGLYDIDEILLLGRSVNKVKAKALDISHSLTIISSKTKIKYSDNYQDIRGSDVIIITSGIVRDATMKGREDLLKDNSKIIKSIALNISKYAFNSFIICITNPLDIMSYLLQKVGSLPKHKVVGMAGILDTARFKYFLAKRLQVESNKIETFVIGSHNQEMLPLLDYTKVKGKPLKDLIARGDISNEELEDIIVRFKDAGSEIFRLSGGTTSYYAPAMAALKMVLSYIQDKKEILVCSTFVENMYGMKQGIYMGMPCKIGKNGVEEIIRLNLNDREQYHLQKSYKFLQEVILTIQ